ncbi:MAG: TetR/AcrR family transcriptional regulator [Acidimicrobiales bacterium]
MSDAEPVPAWKARPEGPEYEAVRERLVDAAEAIVREKGPAALRLDSVAEAAGLHRSSVYRYFGSKEDLLTAVVARASMRVRRKVVRKLGRDAPLERFLTEGLAMALAELVTDPLQQSLMSPSASAAMARAGGKALTSGIRPMVDPVFEAAAEQGMLRPGVTPEDASRWLQIVASGLLRGPEVIPRRDELVRLLETMLVPALFGDRAGTPAKGSPTTSTRSDSKPTGGQKSRR